MAVACPNCGQVDQMQAQLDTYRCLNCNTRSDFGGEIVDNGTSGEVNLVGNFADLNRLGQQMAGGGKAETAFVLPQGTDPKQAEKDTKEQLKGQADDGLINTPPGPTASVNTAASTRGTGTKVGATGATGGKSKG